MNYDSELQEAKTLYLSAQFDPALDLFRKLASKGNGEAMYFLGEYYAQGYGHTAQDLKKAESWRKKGAAAGNILARLNTAYHMSGRSLARKELEDLLFPELLRASEGGDVFAMNELGDMYLYGFGTKVSPEEGVRWLKRAAFWRPWNKLGEIYYHGEGVAKDKEKGRAYFEKAAALGYGDAEGNLAMYWYNEHDDYEKTLSFLRRAFAHGALYEGDIANFLAMMYLDGVGVKKDEKTAFAWMERAGAAGSPAGMNHLAIFYDRGIGTGKNHDLAKKWCKKAADAGQVQAMVQYGIYLREEGTPAKAIGYFQKAADMGDASGMTWLGSCYLYGIGTKKDEGKARTWLEKGAAKGDEDAKEMLEEMKEIRR